MASQKYMKMGLGTAIRRLLDVERQYTSGRRSKELTEERTLLLDALNRLELDIGWDCDDDGVPDTVEIFKQSANTSCCRIMPGSGKSKSPSKSPNRVRKPRK